MLPLIILGEESVIGDNMDTYLQPLLEELQLLWHGVWVRDATNYNGTSHFKLKTILMWCMISLLCDKRFSCMPNLWSRNFFSSI